MFDIWIEKARQKMFGKYEAELEEAEANGETRRVENFLIRIMPRFLASVMVFMGLLYIFNRLYDKYGIERIIIGFGIIFMLSLRSINKTLNNVS